MTKGFMDEKQERHGGVPCGYPGEIGNLGLAMAMKAVDDSRVIEFTRAGVVQLPDYDQLFAVTARALGNTSAARSRSVAPRRITTGILPGKSRFGWNFSEIWR